MSSLPSCGSGGITAIAGGAVAAIPDEAVDALVVHGSPADCVAHINSYVDNGVTVPVILPIPVGMTTHEAALRLAP
ncbi:MULTISPECIES: hypothetical protein [unclassified Amycolatopsis]|uniref:hypothetical protein n=1 Tax=unclassified Amycolatopsis TaxID=2618356 RepID=UPI00210787EB|nr:hypothetical protein [Amycolatopsis sp. DSM 110486]